MLQELQNTPEQNEFSGREYSPEETDAMKRAVLRIFDAWKVKNAEAARLLGGMNPRTLSRWKNGEYGRADIDLADRMSNLLGIHIALRTMFDSKERGYAWVKAPNDVFAGKSALDIMLGGRLADIERVRNYLDSVRGGW